MGKELKESDAEMGNVLMKSWESGVERESCHGVGSQLFAWTMSESCAFQLPLESKSIGSH